VGFQDILGDQVLGYRPEGFEVFAVRIADRRDVVDQRVEPDVGDVIFVER
jgi:hypothetical protein